MIEVLKRGTRLRITCPECGSLLAYCESDVQYTGDYRDENPRFIDCPVCKSEIKVPKSGVSDEDIKAFACHLRGIKKHL